MPVRRLFSTTGFIGLTLLLTALAPLLLPIAALVSLTARLRGALSTLLFLLGYLWCETIGIVLAVVIWLRYRNGAAFPRANYRLQCWWANALKVIAEKVYRLRFEIQGEDALPGPGAIMLPRHASIADTIIPMVYYAIPQQIRLRYVLKRELLVDPCLDIVGNRLPNYFVDRGGQDSERARRGVAALLTDLAPDEGVLIYPEGTRHSAAKHAALRRRYWESADMQAQLDRWPDLLPPRLGGTLALLAANPGRDLLFCAHSGFEGSSHFSNLVNGSWLRANIRIAFWRVPYAQLPHDPDGMRAFLFAQWDRMQATVEALRQGRPVSPPGRPETRPGP